MKLTIGGLLAIVAATAAAALSGAAFEPGDWYQSLRKPDFTPPDFVFPLVWSALYGMMAVSACLIWLTPPNFLRRLGMMLYAAQLLANAAWSWLFFGLHLVGWALVDLVILMGLVSGCIAVFAKAKPLAAFLLIPYLLWGGFAGVLNFWIWRLN